MLQGPVFIESPISCEGLCMCFHCISVSFLSGLYRTYRARNEITYSLSATKPVVYVHLQLSGWAKLSGKWRYCMCFSPVSPGYLESIHLQQSGWARLPVKYTPSTVRLGQTTWKVYTFNSQARPDYLESIHLQQPGWARLPGKWECCIHLH